MNGTYSGPNAQADMEEKSETVLSSGLRQEDLALVQMTSNPTIRQAIDLYKTSGRNSVYPGYRELVLKTIKTGRRMEFKNDSYLDAIFLTELMFSRAERHICFLSGPQADGFLTILKRQFEDAIQRIQINNGSVKAVLLSQTAPEFFLDLKKRFAKTFDFALAKAPGSVQHFMACDSVNARLEESHPELMPDMPADIVRATVYFNEPDQARRLERQFDYLWTLMRRPKLQSS